MSPRDHILRVASDLFYREGIRSVGIDRIIAEAGVAKATLYRHFPSKDELVLTYLRDRHERVISTLEDALKTADLPGPERIREVFAILRAKAGTDPFRGCAFLIAVAETEGLPEARDIAKAHKHALLDIFAAATREFTPDHERLSESIALCYEGALASIAVQRSRLPVDTALRCVDSLIATAPAYPAVVDETEPTAL